MTSSLSGTVLVTGACGFVGNHIARALKQRSLRVVAQVRRNNCALSTDFNTLEGDLCDPETLADCPPDLVGIIHAAANSGRRGESAKRLTRDNVLATRNVLAFAERHNARVVYLSSLSIHGTVSDRVLDGSTQFRQPGNYGRTKHAAEMMLSRNESVCSVSLRLPGILGVGANEHWIGSLVACAMKGDPMTFFNPDAPFNNVVHVSDLAKFTYRLLQMQDWPKADAFPLASTHPMSVLETVRLIRDVLHSKSIVAPMGDRTPHFIIDDSHARIHYGYVSLSTQESIQRFALEMCGQ